MRKPTDEQIDQWVPMMEHAGVLYAARLHKHMILSCANGPVLDVAWEAPQFMHLCGVSKSSRYDAVGFFNDAVRGQLDKQKLAFRDHPDDIKSKMETIDAALGQTSDIKLFVDTEYRGMRAYFGCDEWSIGVYATKSKSAYVSDGFVTVPGSLTQRSMMWSGFPKRGCVVQTVTNVQFF